MWSLAPQVVGASDDGKEYGTDDAQLQLENGTPRSALGIIMLRCAVMVSRGRPRATCVVPCVDGTAPNLTGNISLHHGSPLAPCRFYIMRIQRRGLQFDRITYHARVTQCLGSLTVEPWYLVVAEPTGSVERPPRPEDLHAFRVGTVCSYQTIQLMNSAKCRN